MRDEAIGSGDAGQELRGLAALRQNSALDRATLAKQAAFSLKHRVSPAALEVALELAPADAADVGIFATRMAARLTGTLRGGPTEDVRWWCVADGLARTALLAWAPDAVTALGSCGVPGADAAAEKVRALVEKARQTSPLAAGVPLVELDKAITQVGLGLMDVEDQLDVAIEAAGVDLEKDEWYEAGMPVAPCPDLPPRAPWKPADGLVVGASCALDDLGRVVCSAAVLAELRKAPQGGEAALRAAATSLTEKMTKTLGATLDAVLAIDGPTETPVGFRVQQWLSEPATFVWTTLAVAAVAAGAAWFMGRH